MKLPRWLLACLISTIVLAVPVAVALWWLNRPGPDLSGQWAGSDWGVVELVESEAGSFEGTYSSTFGKHASRIELVWSPRSRRYEGTWSEGTYRFGRVSIWVNRDGSTSGEYSADANCEYSPGFPARHVFQWVRPDDSNQPSPATVPNLTFGRR
jgi:hypothetical protein